MKLLVFSDLHLDAPFAWAGRDVARARRRSLRDTLTRICQLAASEQVDAVLCAGDLYEHERFTPDTVAFVAASFNDLGILAFLAPGNHDWYGPTSLYAQAGFASHVHVFTEDALTPVELAPGLTMWGAAHRAPANTDGFLDDFRVDRDGVNLALFHGSEQGSIHAQESGKLPHAPFHHDQIEHSGLDHAFCGHYHSPRLTPRLTYPGNPDPLAFGEHGSRGAVIAEVKESGEITRTVHDVASTSVHDITVDLSGITHSGEIREQVGAAVAGLSGIVRVTIGGEVPPDVPVDLADLSGVGAHLDALVGRVGDLRVAYDIAALSEEKTVRGQFVRDVLRAGGLDEPTRRRVLITGLRALDDRDDLEVH
jgi:DNA repair exonuclease SbcCD nuclease subunit